jgi:predicted transcriptional regulator
MTEIKTIVDLNTAEVIGKPDIKSHGYMAGSEDEFLQIYACLLGVFYKMEQSEIRVYGYLLRYADGMRFTIGKPLRVQMSKEIDLNERTIYNTLQTLKKKLLIYEKDSLFQINPRFAFRGSRKERNGQLEAIWKLGCKDC